MACQLKIKLSEMKNANAQEIKTEPAPRTYVILTFLLMVSIIFGHEAVSGAISQLARFSRGFFARTQQRFLPFTIHHSPFTSGAVPPRSDLYILIAGLLAGFARPGPIGSPSARAEHHL